ncbi:MAG: hypothetical protein D6729_16135 [Deltaproteobacteria bacterium]|nr:MAG: hypothetical protein D6729_16135 [Deltaproteobacteria bacterium]
MPQRIFSRLACPRASLAVLLVAALAAGAAGCPDEGPAQPSPAGASAAPTPTPAGGTAAAPEGETPLPRAIGAILGRLKLVKEEYQAAIRDGKVINATEYEEAEIFAEQAALRFRRIESAFEGEAAAIAEGVAKDLGLLMQRIAAKAPLSEIQTLVASLVQRIAALNPEEIPQEIEGTVEAVARADATIRAEVQAEGYRIGVFTDAPRTLWLRDENGHLKETPPPEGATHYLGVVVREPRTKRFLPATPVEVRLGKGKPQRLTWVWGDFQHYGGHLSFPEGPFELAVTVGPMAYDRHGDMLTQWTKPATVVFRGRREGAVVRFEGKPPAPAAADYHLGDDVLQALAEAREVTTAGPYRVGFIAERPEPVWLWKDGGPSLVAATEKDTHHLEIALMEQASNRMIPGAKVTLSLVPRSGGAPLGIPLHPLASAFYHYGATVAVPPGDYEVRAKIEPPPFATLGGPRFEGTHEAIFHWNRGEK